VTAERGPWRRELESEEWGGGKKVASAVPCGCINATTAQGLTVMIFTPNAAGHGQRDGNEPHRQRPTGNLEVGDEAGADKIQAMRLSRPSTITSGR
jgi:hypothetical protein